MWCVKERQNNDMGGGRRQDKVTEGAVQIWIDLIMQ